MGHTGLALALGAGDLRVEAGDLPVAFVEMEVQLGAFVFDFAFGAVAFGLGFGVGLLELFFEFGDTCLEVADLAVLGDGFGGGGADGLEEAIKVFAGGLGIREIFRAKVCELASAPVAEILIFVLEEGQEEGRRADRGRELGGVGIDGIGAQGRDQARRGANGKARFGQWAVHGERAATLQDMRNENGAGRVGAEPSPRGVLPHDLTEFVFRAFDQVGLESLAECVVGDDGRGFGWRCGVGHSGLRMRAVMA